MEEGKSKIILFVYQDILLYLSMISEEQCSGVQSTNSVKSLMK